MEFVVAALTIIAAAPIESEVVGLDLSVATPLYQPDLIACVDVPALSVGFVVVALSIFAADAALM